MENKLILMTEFVEKYTAPVVSDNQSSEVAKLLNNLKLISNYNKFLKQPLTLGMFVPVDERGKPYDMQEVEVWKNHSQYSTHYRQELEFFEQACERVLFEGFKLLSDYNGMYRLRNTQNVDITFDSYGCYAEPFDSIPGKRINTIEEITYLELTLTATAIKSIYGS
ncbi:hypothetical protein CMU71_14725 [Elizabethkingia anophelis]|nr:hypothetical protein [Elizabethkingia anophelis]